MASTPVALVLALALAGGAAGAPRPSEGGAGGEEEAPAPAQARPALESAAALIRRCAAAYGGERGRVRLSRTREVGRLSSPLHPGETGRFSRLFARTSRLKVEVAFPGSAPEVRVLDGARAFRYGQPVSGPVALTLQLMAARLDLPALLVEWEGRVTDMGEVRHEGQPVRVMGLEVGPGLRIEAGIDAATARILYVHGLAQNGPSALDLFTVYRDFRMVEGVLVAFHEEGWANGEDTGEVDLDAVEFPEELPDEAFRP
jgi:hypothetical protein